MQTRKRISQRAELLSLLFAGTLILFIAGLAYRSWQAYGRANEEQEITQQIVSATNALLTQLIDAETGQRGFLLTGRDAYLKPYRDAIEKIPDMMRSLESNGVARSDQGERVARMKPLVSEKLDELGQTLELRRTQGQDAALAVVLTDRGHDVMDRIRAICSEIQDAENDRLQRFNQDARSSANELGLISTLGSGALLALLALSTATIRRGMRRREELIDQLTEARDRLQITLASVGDAVVITDAAGNVTFLNPIAEQLTGWKQAEAEGRPIADVFVIRHETTGAPAEDPVAKVIRDHAIVRLANHTVLAAKDGGVIPIEDSAAPIRGVDGQVVGVVLVFRDVTERRGAEDALRRSRERLQLALDAGQIGVWDWDVAKDRIEWSDWVYKIHGMSQGTPPGSVDNYARQIHPEDRERIGNAIRDSLQGDAPYDVEFRVIHPDGSARWVATTGQVFRDEAGMPERMLGATTDITAQKHAADALKLSNAELTRANRGLEEFAYAASHDLQEPLRMVNIYTELIVQEGHSEDPKQVLYTSFVQQGVARMQALLDGLLTFSRASHAEEAPVGSADLSESLREAAALLKDRIEESGAILAAGPLPVVRGDTHQLSHVFQNLLSNSLKYRKPDVRPEISISATIAGGDCVVTFRDNGIGFKQEYAERIFGLFKRLHKEEYPGTGLGLAICKRIVERYGGRTWAEGHLGEGAAFFFSLPLAGDAEHKAG